MAIQAQYPSNVLLLDRDEERTGIGLSRGLPGFLDPSSVIFAEGGGAVNNPRKRAREEAATELPMATGPTPVQSSGISNLLFLQEKVPTYVSLDQLQSKSTAPLVSTGLQLAYGAQQQPRTVNPLHAGSPTLLEELSPRIKQYQHEIDGYLLAQGELLRTLAGKWQSHYRALLSAAAASARRRIRAKEAEAEQAARLRAELEERLSHLRAECMAWQTKAAAAQFQAAALQAQLQQAAEAAAVAREREGESGTPAADADDAGSAVCVDPWQQPAAPGFCRACLRRGAAAAVVMLPCRHLCLCADCAASGAGESCPACGRVSTGSVHVALS